MQAEQLTGVVTEHGEGPVFSPRWNGPRFVDMLRGEVCELQPDGSIERAHVGSVAAMVRPRRQGGWVVADEHGLLLGADVGLDTELQRLTVLTDDDEVRMNEGGCDPAGNLYLGSMAYDSRTGGGQLYRIGADGLVDVVDEAVTISNGIDWSPDDGHCYYADSGTRRIDRFRWSARTGLTDPTSFAELADDDPAIFDGLTVDADGNVWVALFGGGRVQCYSPDGQLVEVVSIPVRQVTAVTFAGADLHDLIVTTSRNGLGSDAEDAAGALFTVPNAGRGRHVLPFAH